MSKTTKGSPTVVHGTAKAPAPTALSTGAAPRISASTPIPRHKLIAMGKHPEVSAGGAKTCP